ncbi:MAG: hypothetical protein FWG03_05040 [Clostridiales bacterium]|nr:hypothetical protein [Clostridiales bacterium]
MIVQDELFGPITLDGLWTGETSITFFGKRYTIMLEIYGDGDDEISPGQREAYSRFKADEDRIVKESEERIFEYYLEIFDDYRDMYLEDSEELADENIPRISSAEELLELIEPASLLIRGDIGDGTRRLGILFNCTWEPEHGLGVSILNEKIDEVGSQDVAL